MKVLTFGEVMLRLKTPEHLKILQADTFEANYGGAEANVAVSLATLGDDVSYVSKVPEHQVGQAAVNEIRRFGVDTSRVLRGGGRVGIYYFEKGTNIRPTSVIYDRAYSAIAMAKAEEFDWEKLLDGVDFFYFSGITPAISTEIEKALENALALCREKKIQVVCDLNYRGKMWSTKDAQRVMRRLMAYVDVCMRILNHHLAFRRTTEICRAALSRSSLTKRACWKSRSSSRTAKRLRVCCAISTPWRTATGWEFT